MNDNTQMVQVGDGSLDKSGIYELLHQVRPVWKAKNLITRVERLIPVDASSACQRLFNAAIHDLKEKIVIVGVDIASEAASNYGLPNVTRDEHIIEYNVSKTIDLAYRIGLLTRSEWRIIHRCYEIRRDLEHEDEEYEAMLQDCIYIFKSTIDIVLSKDPIELLKVTEAKDLVESDTNITVTEEFLEFYQKAPKQRKQEINELLISFAFDQEKPDIVRENSVELMRHLQSRTDKTVVIDLTKSLEERLGKNPVDLKTAKIASACGALGYMKKVKRTDYFTEVFITLLNATDWDDQGKHCANLEDAGGLVHCPDEIYERLLTRLVDIYIGEPSYGPWSGYRPVFYSDPAAPIIRRMIEGDKKRAGKYMEKVRESKPVNKHSGFKAIMRRFDALADLCEAI